MITVVIPTLDSERLLVPTLAALVPGSTEGLVREVMIVDGGSTDETEKIANAAGCEWLHGVRDEGARLAAASNAARGDWLLFLDAGAELDGGWTREVAAFVARVGPASERAATFRFAIEASGPAARLREAAASARLTLFGMPRPDQGLLIAKPFYRSLGGHSAGPHPRRRLFARIGRGRLFALQTRITVRSQ